MSKPEPIKQQGEILQFNDYEKVKFTFQGLDKYIVMELNTKIALEDLKFTFANILKTDFFAKKLQFYATKALKEHELKPQKSLGDKDQQIPKEYKAQVNQQLNIKVKFIEEGA